MCSKTQQYDGIFSRKKITGAPSRTIVSFKFVPVVFQREAEVMQIATVWAFLDVWYGCVLLTVKDCICLLYPAGTIKPNQGAYVSKGEKEMALISSKYLWPLLLRIHRLPT